MATSSEAGSATTRPVTQAYLLLLVMPILFSSNLIIGRAIGEAVQPFTLALLRWAVAALTLLPFTWRSLKAEAAALLASGRRILVLGFLGMWICGAGVYWALSFTTATNATLIYTVSPVLVLLIEVATTGRKLPLARLAGVLVAMLGVAVIVLRGDLTAIARLDLNIGDLAMAAAALAWAFYSLLLKDEGLARIPTLTLFTAIALAGAATLLPCSIVELIVEGGWPRTWSSWAGVVGLALFSAVGAFSLYQYGVKVVGPSVTSCFLYLLPVYGVGMAVIFLGEQFRAYHIVGMGLVLAGLIAATAPRDLIGALARRFGLSGRAA